MKRILLTAATLFCLSVVANVTTAQSPPSATRTETLMADDPATWDDLHLTDDMPASVNGAGTAASSARPMSQSARLRLSRAIYRDRQRIARLEANAWMGYEPLRPSWPSIPMTSSRYTNYRTVVIPVYVP